MPRMNIYVQEGLRARMDHRPTNWSSLAQRAFERQLKGIDTMNDTIDLTPTWAHAAKICIMVLRDGSEQGKDMAEEELMKMARTFDALIDGRVTMPEQRRDDS